MDNNTRRLQTKRFVIEDSYTKVTADGEPHEMMTLIAGLAGMLAAIIILIVLISLIVCKKDESSKKCKNCAAGNNSPECLKKKMKKRDSDLSSEAQRSSISTVCTGTPSITDSPKITPNGKTDFSITKGNFGGNLNAAFVDSEFNLADSLRKAKKKMRWNDEVIVHDIDKQTVINMTER